MHNAAQAYGKVARQIATPRELEANLLLKAASQLQTICNEWPKRHAELYAALLRNDISKWGDRFLKTLVPQGKESEAREAQALRDFVAAPATGSAAIGPARPPATRQ